LSNKNLEELIVGARVEVSDNKKNPEDFVLWKPSKDKEPYWESPWGKGRPGWHIECSAMTHTILNNPFDIHGGGQDLIFPHHEDEIAQSEAGYGKKMCNYWVHNGMVNVDKIKMSKSLGNFKTIKDLLKNYSGEVIRYFVIGAHYRKPIDFSEKRLDEAKKSLEKLRGLITKLEKDDKENKKYLKEFQKNMDDDLNTSGALNLLWKLVRDPNAKGKYSTIKKIDKVFGLKLFEKKMLKIPREVQKLLDERKKAREQKDFNTSDVLRNKIKELGFYVKDLKDGTELKKL